MLHHMSGVSCQLSDTLQHLVCCAAPPQLCTLLLLTCLPCVMQFISCSALLADLRAVQKEKASLAGRLEAAQAQAARQKKQYDHDVSVTRP